MSALSDYAEVELLDHLLGTTAYTMPTTVYMALYTAAPSDAGGGTEISGNNYARQALSFGAAASGSAANDGAVTFTCTGGDWGTVTHFGIFDAASAGNLLVHGALTASREILDGDEQVFAIGDVTVGAD